MQSILVNNYTFYYQEAGRGSPVVFVHGSISDYRTWEKQMEPFVKHFHVLAYSRRYHFPNSTDGDYSDYTFAQHSKDLAGFIEALDLGKVSMVGSSYGAYVGLLTAIRHPRLVSSLVLGEPPVIPFLVSDLDNPLEVLWLMLRDFSTGKSFFKFGMKSAGPAKKALQRGHTEEGVRLFANGVLGEGGYERLPDDVKPLLLDNAEALRAELLGPGFPEKFPEEKAAGMQVPTLLLRAENSPEFFHAITEKLHKILPKARKVNLAGTSHNMHEESPQEYNREVLKFLLQPGK